jgi:hypothetical protein
VLNSREATLEDFANFELHEKNIEELKASLTIDIDVIMAFLWDNSQDKTIVFVDNKPTCLLGVINSTEVWLFFSKDIDNLPISFFKLGKKFIERYDYLQGHIYSENIFALQWAKFMGFIIEEPQPYGVNGELFHKFYKKVV